MLPSLALPLLAALSTQVPPDTLAAVDLYGLRTVPEPAVRAAVGLRPGDPVPATTDSVRARVAAIPGVAEVDVSRVCCGDAGGTLLFVGIREAGTPAAAFRDAPAGAARLPADIVAAGAALDSALTRAVQRGAGEEDRSRGYSLALDSAMRAVQQQFIHFAALRADTLRAVLLTSADAGHRALAAEVIAYAPDRQAVARDLLHAVADPDDGVRNNAVRALALLAGWANAHPEAGVVIPPDPFIGLLGSVSWSDRNKGVFALIPLTESRDPALLAALRARALPSLVEMARWTNPGHALGAFMVLARIAGVDDASAFQAFQSGERETVIARALAAQR